MSIPFFYSQHIAEAGKVLELDEETSRHLVQVLRKEKDEQIRLTDGQGKLALAEILEAHKKHSTAKIISSTFTPRVNTLFTIAISLVKNPSRFEWFIEKAAELGIYRIIPLLCDRTEKQHARHDRFLGISKSAMLQSAQSWLTEIGQPAKFGEVVSRAGEQQKFIAYCEEGNKQPLPAVALSGPVSSRMILIGPEGDFSPAEIQLALSAGFQGVSLGKTRLRTETAGLYAAVMGSV